MRKGLVIGHALGVLNGALAIAVVWWLGRRPGDFGWYSYTPLTRSYSAYFVTKDAIVPGWELALVMLAAFVVVNAAAVTAALCLRRRRAPQGA